MKRIFVYILTFISIYASAKDLPVHCDKDIDVINSLLLSLQKSELPLGDRIVMAAESFSDAETDDYYLKDSIGILRINIDSFTPLMLVNNAIALAKASEYPGLPNIGTFSKELVNIACRKGENHGFPSIMYHSSDWIGDNSARGNVIELTENYAGMIDRTKSLDEMTRKRQNYAALSDSVTFETVRMTEMGFRTHRIPTLKKETIKKKELTADLKNGDIIILVPNRDGIDYYDIGIVKIENDMPHLIHLSPRTGKVKVEEEDLARYMGLMTKYFQGYRIVRVKE